jgi:hypothetical protein
MQPEISTTTVTVTPYGEKKNINGYELTQEGDNEHLFSVDINLTKDQALTVGGLDISDWWIDPDFFNKTGEKTLAFLPIAGKYRIIADTEHKYFKVRVLSGNVPAQLQNDGSGAIWAVGEGLGDPTIANIIEWDPVNAICLAPLGNGRYQLSGVAGQRFKTDKLGIKFIPEYNSWRAIRWPDIENSDKPDGDKADPRFATLTNDYIRIDDGDNVHLKNGWTLQEGATYTFILDVSEGYQNIQLSIFENGTELTTDSSPNENGITINGTPMTKSGVGGIYYTADVDLTQDVPINIGGDMAKVMEVFNTWWLDPDYIRIGEYAGQPAPYFIPVTGKYRVTANMRLKYFKVEVLNGGGGLATLQTDGTGAIWVIGKGIGKPNLTNNRSNFGADWVTEDALCMAPIVHNLGGESPSAQYRITLKAGETLYPDAIHFKFFYQPGWGGEFKDVTEGTNYAIETSSTLVDILPGGDVALKTGQTFDAGATYTFTIELATLQHPQIQAATLIVEKVE